MNDFRKRNRNDVCTEFGKNLLNAIVATVALLLLTVEYFSYGDRIIIAPNLITQIVIAITAIIAFVLLPRELGWFVRNRKKYASEYIEDISSEGYWIEGGILIAVSVLLIGALYILITSCQGNLGPFFLIEGPRKYLWAERVLWGSGVIFILAIAFYSTIMV